MKIGLTGATGFIGKYYLQSYSDKVDLRIATSTPSKLEKTNIGKGLIFQSDYSYESFLKAFEGCDAVIHLGAKVPNQASGFGNMTDYLKNSIVADNLFRAVAELRIKKVVDISSVAVYSKSKTPLREDDAFTPNNAYGVSKAAVEIMSEAYARNYGFDVVSLRVSQVLGYKSWSRPCFFSMLQDNAYLGIPITVYGSGKATRDFIYVKDVVYAIQLAVEKDCKGPFNIASGIPVSNLELAQTYVKAFNSHSEITFLPVTREDLQYWYCDTSKAKEQLGFVPKYDLFDMVRDIRDYYFLSH